MGNDKQKTAAEQTADKVRSFNIAARVLFENIRLWYADPGRVVASAQDKPIEDYVTADLTLHVNHNNTVITVYGTRDEANRRVLFRADEAQPHAKKAFFEIDTWYWDQPRRQEVTKDSLNEHLDEYLRIESSVRPKG